MRLIGKRRTNHFAVFNPCKQGGCEKSPLKVKRTLSGMKPGGVLFFVVKLSYYE